MIVTGIPTFDGMALMTRFSLASVRPLAMLMLLPGFAGALLPWRARLAVASALAIFTAFRPGAPVLSFAMLPGEIMAGLCAGLAVALAFGAAQLAGEVVAQMMGLGFASVPGAGGNVTVISGLFTVLMWLAFLTMDGHLLLFGEIVAGQGALPPGNVTSARVAAYGVTLFVGGLRLALPLVGLLLIGNLLVAVAGRSAPQLGAMAVGPAALLLGFVWLLPLLFDTLLGRAQMTLDAAMVLN